MDTVMNWNTISNIGAFGVLIIFFIWLIRTAFPALREDFKQQRMDFLKETKEIRDHCERHNEKIEVAYQGRRNRSND